MFPDLVADIRSLEHLKGIPDHSVDQFYFDGVTYDEVYNADLAAVLARKLKPGGVYLDNTRSDLSALLGPRFRAEALAPGENWLGYGEPRKYRLLP